MTNLKEFINQKFVFYYASSVNSLDNKNSFEFWFNSGIIRIIADRPFARGDLGIIKDIDLQNRIIYVEVLDMVEADNQPLPILLFVASRIHFNEYSDFYAFSKSEDIKIISVFSSIQDNNLLPAVVLLAKDSGTITLYEEKFSNEFDLIINIEWE